MDSYIMQLKSHIETYSKEIYSSIHVRVTTRTIKTNSDNKIRKLIVLHFNTSGALYKYAKLHSIKLTNEPWRCEDGYPGNYFLVTPKEIRAIVGLSADKSKTHEKVMNEYNNLMEIINNNNIHYIY